MKNILLITTLLMMPFSIFGKESEIVKDAKKASQWIQKAMSSSGYRLDYTINSFKEIDRFYEEHTLNGKPKSGGLLSEDLGSRLFAIGSYIGDVLVREARGKWKGDDKDKQAEINIEVVLPDGTICWPVQRAMKRLQNGTEDSIYVYGIVVMEKSKEK